MLPPRYAFSAKRRWRIELGSKREDGIPTCLHIDHGPAPLDAGCDDPVTGKAARSNDRAARRRIWGRFAQGLVKSTSTIVCVFGSTYRIAGEPLARFPSISQPLQSCQTLFVNE